MIIEESTTKKSQKLKRKLKEEYGEEKGEDVYWGMLTNEAKEPGKSKIFGRRDEADREKSLKKKTSKSSIFLKEII